MFRNLETGENRAVEGTLSLSLHFLKNQPWDKVLRLMHLFRHSGYFCVDETSVPHEKINDVRHAHNGRDDKVLIGTARTFECAEGFAVSSPSG